jgi:hypothetical protein
VKSSFTAGAASAAFLPTSAGTFFSRGANSKPTLPSVERQEGLELAPRLLRNEALEQVGLALDEQLAGLNAVDGLLEDRSRRSGNRRFALGLTDSRRRSSSRSRTRWRWHFGQLPTGSLPVKSTSAASPFSCLSSPKSNFDLEGRRRS